MAVRSGAGTGVVVSLVVFILTTVFLLVLTIVFYAKNTKELEARKNAEDKLAEYVRAGQRNTDQFKAYEDEAKRANQSVAGHLAARYEQLMTYVDGNPAQTFEGLQASLKRLGVADESVRATLNAATTKLAATTNDLANKQAELDACSASLAEKQAQFEQAKKDHEEQLAQVQEQIGVYQKAGDEYRQQLDAALGQLEQAKETLKSRYMGDIAALEGEVERLNKERVVLIGRLNELQKKVESSRIALTQPGALVDGQVIEIGGTNDQVFIDKGRNNRIVLGMTFEVYDEARNIAADPRTGEAPRGKASLQVIQVGDTSSKCRITRATAGRPVVRGDVIANAVYDPDYRFKFLIHGKFDVDNDGKPTEQEAEHLRSLVLDWGGTTVTGETLPGDLDFLVLGQEPPMPLLPAPDAPQQIINDYVNKRNAHELYKRLFNQATEAQIPVLNANRFLILIGHTND